MLVCVCFVFFFSRRRRHTRCALLTGVHTCALPIYIAARTDINTKDPFGESSPLITAAVFGRPEMARILIESGADLNFQNKDGSTALISAAFFGHPQIV